MTIAALRIKNEVRWISKVIESLRPVCEDILILDDHSDDGTAEICRSLGAQVIPSPFGGLDEARDKQFLLQRYIVPMNPDWVIAIDGDEVLTEDSIAAIQKARLKPSISRCSFDILFLWDREDQIRVDGVYRERNGDYRRSSMYRVKSQKGLHFKTTSHGGNFHCRSVPDGLKGGTEPIKARLLHYGYLHKEDRIRKYKWYREHDPQSKGEGEYQHIVIGDLFPASSRFLHGGPLKLAPLHGVGK